MAAPDTYTPSNPSSSIKTEVSGLIAPGNLSKPPLSSSLRRRTRRSDAEMPGRLVKTVPSPASDPGGIPVPPEGTSQPTAVTSVRTTAAQCRETRADHLQRRCRRRACGTSRCTAHVRKGVHLGGCIGDGERTLDHRAAVHGDHHTPAECLICRIACVVAARPLGILDSGDLAPKRHCARPGCPVGGVGGLHDASCRLLARPRRYT